MAITIIQQPQGYMPAYNSQFFQADSNQKAQPNFNYTIKVTDLLTGVTETYPVPPRPDGLCVFDSGVFAENQIRDDNDIPANVYGWDLAHGIRKIRVNIGETYGTTPTYHAGTNIDYIIWNAIIDFLQYPGYNMNDYIYDTTVPALNYFAAPVNDDTYEDRSNYIYILSSKQNEVSQIQITTRDINGVFIANSIIPNPFSSTASYDDRYFCIDVGYKGLFNISSGLVTGTYPIITPAVAEYDVIDFDPGLGVSQLIKSIKIKCNNRYQVMTVHYLAKSGAFNSINFNLAWESTDDKTVTSYKQSPFSINAISGLYGYSYSAATEKILSVLTQGKLKLRTDYLTDEQVIAYKECFSSNICYLDIGSSIGYCSIKPITTSYRNIPYYDEKLFRLEIDFNLDHQNSRQRT